ncbi:MAG: HAD-IIB family hydrolase [Oscillibacter sp.]
MGKFTGVLLASDFDNTLLNTETARRSGSEVPEVSPENQAALRYFMEAGGRFAIATGRALAAFEKFADQVPMNSPGILCNGAALYDFRQHAYLDVILLDADIRSRGKAVMDAFPSVAVEAYPLENVIHAVRPNLYTRQHEHVTHVAVQEDPTLLETPYPLTKLMFEDDHDRLLEIQAHLARQSWCQEYEIFFSDRTLLEMTARGASKGGMVCRLAERLGIAREQVYCVGDEANDLSMLAFAAEGFAPENCVPAVRQCGATLMPDCEHHTLAAIVAYLDKKY